MAQTPDYASIHKEHRQWLTDLNFYHDEIKYYQNQLAQISAQHEKDDKYHKEFVDFKRRLFDTLWQIDSLRYTIYKHEKDLAEYEKLAERTQVHINEDHHSKKDEFNNFTRDYEKLKNDISEFLEKAMD